MPNFVWLALGGALALFLGMLLFFELGRRLGLRQAQKLGAAARAGIGGIDSAVYALLALLLGFAFSGAASRFDHRKELISKEVNAMSTAWLRVASLPADKQAGVRADFRRYMDGVIASYKSSAGSPSETQARAATDRAQNDLWSRSMAASLGSPEGEKARMLLLPSLNEMFDLVDEERLVRRIHPPPIIYIMLALSAFAAALFGGYGMAIAEKRNWLVIVGVSATISLTAFLVLELETPRLGFVQVRDFDRALVELRETMNDAVTSARRPPNAG
ncbi:MAG: DUF4239 domain-containing protein [Gemmatimonadaceae bacterium]